MSTFHLQIVTPDGLYLDDQVESVTVRTTEGDQTILKNHSPYVAAPGACQAGRGEGPSHLGKAPG